MPTTHISLTTLKKNVHRVVTLLKADHCVLLVHNGEVLFEFKLVGDERLKSKKLEDKNTLKSDVVKQRQEDAVIEQGKTVPETSYSNTTYAKNAELKRPDSEKNSPPVQPKQPFPPKVDLVALGRAALASDNGSGPYPWEGDPGDMDEKLNQLLAAQTDALLKKSN